MDKIVKEVAKTIDWSTIDEYKPLVLVNIQEAYLDLASQILSSFTNEKFCIKVYDKPYPGVFDKKEEVKFSLKDIFFNTYLEKLGYTRVKRVWEEGEYSVLGDTVTFWPKGNKEVVRISLFGESIERISLLDVDTRALIKDVESFKANLQSRELRNIYGDTLGKIIYFFRELDDDLDAQLLDLGIRPFFDINRLHLPKIIDSYKKQGYTIYGFSNEEVEDKLEVVEYLLGGLKRGFVHSISKQVVLGDFELIGKLDLGDYTEEKKKKGEDIFKQISPGDYVVHEDHGVGIYEKVVEQLGVLYLDIHYAKNDRLLIPLQASEKLTKYVGAGKGKPTLTGLNSGIWGRIRSKAKESIEKIARELVALYAMRSVTKSPKLIKNELDIQALNSFIETFQHQDTEDQQAITNEIVEDLSREIPMDRLIVGDVGFGKTELAARATFLTSNAGYQVAILTPTTILAQQHYNLFKERFKNYPFRIEMLSRFVSKKAREEILQGITKGTVDIVIGTHALLSDNIEFKNLATLIIDEEQKFGVMQKEKIKEKKLSVNVLSITATPIPRTLNIAMSGIKDLSILASVPMGRKAIKNKIGKYDFNEIIDGIEKEIGRGGQVYYLHNRVNDLEKIKISLERALPKARIALTHGQMGEITLSSVMRDFAQNKYDVLLCSTIIENGIDLPNVNTLIIDDAQRYGLSQLYQIRGRIGRSDVQAYAHIMYSQLSGDLALRLDAIAEAYNLGAGFILSSRDLEIRGAGNILGKSQSGTINSIGYALYTQMLEEALSKIRG